MVDFHPAASGSPLANLTSSFTCLPAEPTGLPFLLLQSILKSKSKSK